MKATEQSIWINVLGTILIVLACLSLCAIIFFVLYPFFDKDIPTEFLNTASVNGLVLSCITLSVTLAIVVPWMMSKSQINAVAENAVKQYYDKDFSQTIRKTHNSLFQAYANESRMIAFFLCQHNKPVWALGWVCKSSTTYDRIQEANQKKTYAALAVSNVYVLIDCILRICHKMKDPKDMTLEEIINADNDEKEFAVALRTTRDLIKFCSTIELRDKDYASVFKDRPGRDIPETLNVALNDFLMCLMKVLISQCEKEKEDLFEKMELVNDEEVDADKHAALFYKIFKLCEKHDQGSFNNKFLQSAMALDTKYQMYLKTIRSTHR